MDKIESVVDRLPGYYDSNSNSQVYNLLKAFTDEFDIVSSQYIDRADSAIGVDKTNGNDLDWRWGSLLNVMRRPGENDGSYRKRLSLATNALHGGTADSIRYAISVFLGISSDDDKTRRYIKIYDGWKYQHAEPSMKHYGHIVCVLSFDSADRGLYYDGIENDIRKYVANIKAAGTILHVMTEFTTYGELSAYTHQQMSARTHEELRKWGV